MLEEKPGSRWGLKSVPLVTFRDTLRDKVTSPRVSRAAAGGISKDCLEEEE